MGNKGLYVVSGTPGGDISDDICLKTKSKYAEKLLVWLAISEKGISKSYLMKYTARNAFQNTSNHLLKNIIGTRILFFWPNLATAHYAHATTTLPEDLEVPYVPRDKNPANSPQLRPIKKCSAILKEEVYKNGLEAKFF